MLALGFTIPSAAALRRCTLVTVPFANTEIAANFVAALTAWGHILQTTLTAFSALALSRANSSIPQKERLQNSMHVTVIISGNSVAQGLPLLPTPQLPPLSEAPAHRLSQRNPPRPYSTYTFCQPEQVLSSYFCFGWVYGSRPRRASLQQFLPQNFP